MHPIADNTDVQLWIMSSLHVDARVMSSYQDQNGIWRYELQSWFRDDQTNSETVELSEVAQCLVIAPEEK